MRNFSFCCTRSGGRGVLLMKAPIKSLRSLRAGAAEKDKYENFVFSAPI